MIQSLQWHYKVLAVGVPTQHWEVKSQKWFTLVGKLSASSAALLPGRPAADSHVHCLGIVLVITSSLFKEIKVMTGMLSWSTMEKIKFTYFFSFVNREINVNLIMMQSWRRGKRSANFIYKDIVPKERTAFICIISFTIIYIVPKILRSLKCHWNSFLKFLFKRITENYRWRETELFHH